jgi:hypothetical protein
MRRLRVVSISFFFLSALVGRAISLSEEEVQIPFSPDYDPYAEEFWTQTRSGRAMYLAQGVEFVFPIGVQYTLANVNEQLWPIGTTGFDTVLEFPKNKIAIMFSSMINTLKIVSRLLNPSIRANTHFPYFVF